MTAVDELARLRELALKCSSLLGELGETLGELGALQAELRRLDLDAQARQDRLQAPSALTYGPEPF